MQVKLPVLDNPLSTRVNHIAQQLQSDRSRALQLRIVRQEMDPIEFAFSTWMAEDRNAEVQTYVDYMCKYYQLVYSYRAKSVCLIIRGKKKQVSCIAKFKTR